MRPLARYLGAVLALILFCACAAAQTYPTRPVRLLLPYAPGGGTDFFARTVSQRMAELLGQPVIVDNRPGASSIIAAEALTNAQPDGYTVMIGGDETFALNPALFKKLPYDPQKSFVPITLTGRYLLTLAVNPAVPAQKLDELLQLSRAGTVSSYASPGTGTPHHLAMELLKQRAGVQLVAVPYKGTGPAMLDVMSGQIGVMFADLAAVTPHMKSGKLKVIAVASAGRSALLPSVPTIAESGFPGFEAWAWQGLIAPQGTPAAIVDRLRDAYMKATADPTIRSRLVEAGIEPLSSTPQEMADYMLQERGKWAKVVREANIIPQ